eukprot:m.621004 g.621004  ORF g.621004 m.621004 type:complete len:54 (-) comp22538_c0_seq17:2533-2694(-)
MPAPHPMGIDTGTMATTEFQPSTFVQLTHGFTSVVRGSDSSQRLWIGLRKAGC